MPIPCFLEDGSSKSQVRKSEIFLPVRDGNAFLVLHLSNACFQRRLGEIDECREARESYGDCFSARIKVQSTGVSTLTTVKQPLMKFLKLRTDQ